MTETKDFFSDEKTEKPQEGYPKLSPHLMSGGEKIKSFPYSFTEDEKAKLAIEAAHAYRKTENAKDQKKAIVKQHDEIIQSLQNAYNLLNGKVISGIEQRDFKCRIELDFSTAKKYYIDVVTGKELGDAPLDADDYQLKVDFDMAEQKKAEKLAEELLQENLLEEGTDLNLTTPKSYRTEEDGTVIAKPIKTKKDKVKLEETKEEPPADDEVSM